MGTKELKQCTVRTKILRAGPIRAAKAEQRKKISSTGTTSPNVNEPAKEGHLSFVLLESRFISVSTLSRGHSSLFSLVVPECFVNIIGSYAGF
jgi:hypothetical protein